MEQLAFFPEAGQSKGLPVDLLEYFPALIAEEKGNFYLQRFIDTAPWKQTVQKMYDKEVVAEACFESV